MEKVLVNRKDFERRFREGWVLCDDQEFEPGRCSNGGHYRTVYRRRGRHMESRTSYEDGSWEQLRDQRPVGDGISEEILQLVEYVKSTIDDKCFHIEGPRWSWARPEEW